MSYKSMWSLRNIYLYIVCLITLVMVIFSTVNLVKALVEIVYPEPESIGYVVRVPQSPAAEPKIEEERLQEQQEIQKRRSSRRAVLNMVGSATMLLLAGPLYVYHWRKIERERLADGAQIV